MSLSGVTWNRRLPRSHTLLPAALSTARAEAPGSCFAPGSTGEEQLLGYIRKRGDGIAWEEQAITAQADTPACRVGRNQA